MSVTDGLRPVAEPQPSYRSADVARREAAQADFLEKALDLRTTASLAVVAGEEENEAAELFLTARQRDLPRLRIRPDAGGGIFREIEPTEVEREVSIRADDVGVLGDELAEDLLAIFCAGKGHSAQGFEADLIAQVLLLLGAEFAEIVELVDDKCEKLGINKIRVRCCVVLRALDNPVQVGTAQV
ncbi:hypothetical protein [Sinorhizobium meliloti]|uniref:hypothetical protein n=1 Tax=Rhizobium meliloti TaxID=382 RepID=UPI000B4A1251|nr:hypothetical protein [Sinorhizobium meliloti]ASP98406.1 hypothetical protein CDO24_13785 [Sinorhizobium meliloti]MQV66151.1 hypothetical protein [Sinorhizobium meliloti]